jgi:hypothetical protein
VDAEYVLVLEIFVGGLGEGEEPCVHADDSFDERRDLSFADEIGHDLKDSACSIGVPHEEYLIDIDLFRLLEDAIEQVTFNYFIQDILCFLCPYMQVFISIPVE